jgi:hypothetical protein
MEKRNPSIKVQGSISRKVVATELEDERSRCDFNTQEVQKIYFFNKESKAKRDKTLEIIKSVDGFKNTHLYYDMTREEKIVYNFKRLNLFIKTDRKLVTDKLSADHYISSFFMG